MANEAADLDAVFRRIEDLAAARGLEGVERGTNYGTPSLSVKDRTFVRLKDGGTLVVMCPIEQKALLIEIAPEIYYDTDHYLGWPAVLVRLDVIADEELALRLEDAWAFKAPARLVAERKARAGQAGASTRGNE